MTATTFYLVCVKDESHSFAVANMPPCAPFAMRVYSNKIQYKYFLDSETPEPVLDHKSLHKADGSPSYCDNHIVWHEENIDLDADVWNSFTKCSNRFYHAFYDHLVNGAELFMKPEHVKAEIAIFNEIERQNPLKMKFTKPADVI